MMFYWPLISIGLLLATFASFGWGMRKFFSRPAGDNTGMKVIRALGSLGALLTLAAMIATPDVSPRRVLAGAAMYLTALALFFWAIRTHGRTVLSAAFSPDSPQHVVFWGPYRFIRHPFYTAYLLAFSAGFVATGRWWLLPTVVLMLVIYIKAANGEEQKFAASPLADAYRDYQASTGQFLPNPIKLLRSRKKEDNAPRLAQHSA